jgi:nitrous oxide reductase accessory protein NosL
MKKLLLTLLATSVLLSCTQKTNTGLTTYDVKFEEDWVCNWCGDPTKDPNVHQIITDTSVQFRSGRVVSTHGYKNITQITATIDLSGMAPNSVQNNNWLNASFYMVNSAIQPKGDSYCDAGGSVPYCNEIDFMETNGNRILQTTIHLDNAQRFEYTLTEGAFSDNCYGNLYATEQGTHSIVDVIDITKPFLMTIDFNSDYTNMTVTVSQNGKSEVIYDVLSGKGADNSNVDMTSLKSSMEVGWWITPSYWEGYSPKGPGAAPWFIGDCYSDQLCKNNDNAWVISNVKVTAESEI